MSNESESFVFFLNKHGKDGSLDGCCVSQF